MPEHAVNVYSSLAEINFTCAKCRLCPLSTSQTCDGSTASETWVAGVGDCVSLVKRSYLGSGSDRVGHHTRNLASDCEYMKRQRCQNQHKSITSLFTVLPASQKGQ